VARGKSEQHKSLDQLQSHLRSFLKPHGFRTRGLTFNRATSDGLIHAVQIQAGRYDPPGTVHIPWFRENLYGRFTVNLGIWVPEVAKYIGFGTSPSFVNEMHCCIRARLGELGPEGTDIWWDIRDDAAALDSEIRGRLERDAFPFFARYESRDLVLKSLDGVTVSISGGNPPRIICAIILAERDERTKARALLAAQAKENSNHGHAAYVTALAEKLGLVRLDNRQSST
jgi:hypothetical protein